MWTRRARWTVPAVRPVRPSTSFCPTIIARTHGDAALREVIARVAAEEGEPELQRLLFDVVLKLAELTERFAAAQQLTAVDLADILFLD
jgi:hypothetical protein